MLGQEELFHRNNVNGHAITVSFAVEGIELGLLDIGCVQELGYWTLALKMWGHWM